MIKFRCPGCPEVYSVEDRHGWETSVCPKCKADFRIPGDGEMPETAKPRPPESKRIVAALTAIFLGAFGVHKFILGYTKAGLIHLLLTVATCGLMKIVGIIEGIIYLTKSDAEFVKTYQVGTKEWF